MYLLIFNEVLPCTTSARHTMFTRHSGAQHFSFSVHHSIVIGVYIYYYVYIYLSLLFFAVSCTLLIYIVQRATVPTTRSPPPASRTTLPINGTSENVFGAPLFSFFVKYNKNDRRRRRRRLRLCVRARAYCA